MPSGGSLTADQWLLLSTVYGPIVVSFFPIHKDILLEHHIRYLNYGVLVSQVLIATTSCKIVLHRLSDWKPRRLVRQRRNLRIVGRSMQLKSKVKKLTHLRGLVSPRRKNQRLLKGMTQDLKPPPPSKQRRLD